MSLYKFASATRLNIYRCLLSTDRKFLLNNVREFVRKNTDEVPKSRVYTKALLSGVAAGAVVGVGCAVYESYKSKDAHLVHERREALVLDELPKFRVMRKIVNPKDKHNLDLVLFQYQTCPFCCKVRTFLDGAGFSYSVVEVS